MPNQTIFVAYNRKVMPVHKSLLFHQSLVLTFHPATGTICSCKKRGGEMEIPCGMEGGGEVREKVEGQQYTHRYI
jgi:hypothetical protein